MAGLQDMLTETWVSFPQSMRYSRLESLVYCPSGGNKRPGRRGGDGTLRRGCALTTHGKGAEGKPVVLR